MDNMKEQSAQQIPMGRDEIGNQIPAPVPEWDQLLAAMKHGPTADVVTEANIKANKYLRQQLDVSLQRLKSLKPSRNRALSITHLEDSIMRLGMDLKDMNQPNPYPNSYNPANVIVDKTADNLTL